MTKELDLSSALGLRVANVDALALRIANVDVWQAASSGEHSVWGDTVPYSWVTGTDLGAGGWVGNIFYGQATGSRLYFNWKIKGVKIYVPAGSAAIGQTATMGLQMAPEGTGIFFGNTGNPGGSLNAMQTNGTKTTFAQPLVAGWNTCYFTSEYSLGFSDAFTIAYTIGDGSTYMFSSISSGSAVPATDGTPLFLSSDDEGYSRRGFYGNLTGGTVTYDSWSAGSYAIDPIIDTSGEFQGDSLFGLQNLHSYIASDNAAVTVGTVFSTEVNGTITHLRFWQTPANAGTETLSLYGPGQTLLRQVSYAMTTGDQGWRQVAITPVSATAGDTFLVAYRGPVLDQAYVGQTSMLSSSYPNASASLVAVAGGDTPAFDTFDGNGRYNYTDGDYPSNSFNSTCYFADVVFLPTA